MVVGRVSSVERREKAPSGQSLSHGGGFRYGKGMISARGYLMAVFVFMSHPVFKKAAPVA